MSNKKTLLNEGTIRRFMTLANMDNLAESYLDRYEVNEGEEEEEVEEGMRPAKHDDDKEVEEGMRAAKEDDEVEEGMRAAKDDDEVEEGMRGLGKHDDEEEPAMRDLDEEELDLDVDAEAELDAPDEAPAEEGGADEAMVKKLVDAIAGAIEGATGVEVAVEGGDEEPELDLDAPEEGGEELDLGMDDEAAMRDEPAKHDLEEDEDFDAYIAEVTRRVAKRIIKKKISK